MSLKYRDKNGAEVVLAGLTPGGNMETGAVATRSGIIKIPITASHGSGTIMVSFSEDMPDEDYVLNIVPRTSYYTLGADTYTKSGFRLIYQNSSTSSPSIEETVDYTAYKLYEVADAEELYSTVQDIEAMVPANASSTNKFTTADDLRTETRTLDRRLDDVEDVVPTSASITNKLVTKSEASVDSALSSTSEHAVQNKVVKAAIDAKQDTLTFDTSPTSGSTNPVTSSGVYTALQDKADKVTSATNGNFAGLDANGNLTDSGKKASDFVSTANLDALNQIAAGIYEGMDLTVKFADEIANYTDEWAWVQARLDAHDVSGMLPGDYIPIVVGTETHQAQIAGINTYYGTCDSGYEVKYHIDWITRDCYGEAIIRWNTTDNNNGSSTEASPFLASHLNNWLNSTLYGRLEAKLKAVIKEKRILAPTRYQNGSSLTDDNSWAWKTTGKLWVPYETEIFDNVQWSTKGFGESQNVQYEIFRNSYRARRKKQGPTGARADWWTASALSGNATYAVFVGSYGDSNSSSALTNRYAPVCFRTMATT